MLLRVAFWFKNHGSGSNVDLTMLILDVKERCVDVSGVKLKRNDVGLISPDMDLRFNVDGAAKGSPGEAGIGGVLRDSKGKILCLFSNYVGSLDAISAEMYAIHRACQLIAGNISLSHRFITIVSDSKTAVDWIKSSEFGSIQLVHLIYDIRQFLKSSVGFDIQYVPRELNSFADSLAKATYSGGSNRLGLELQLMLGLGVGLGLGLGLRLGLVLVLGLG